MSVKASVSCGNRHAVIIQHEKQLSGSISYSVQRFESFSRGESSVTQHYSNPVFFSELFPRFAHPCSCTYCRSAVSAPVRIIRALPYVTEAAHALFAPKLFKTPAAEYFVSVSLMPYVENYFVGRQIHRFVQRDGKLDGTEIGGGMSAVIVHRFDYFFSETAA